MNRDGIPDDLHQPHIDYGVSVQYESPVSYKASMMTVTGVDMNLDGNPDELQQPQINYAVPLQHAAPAVTYCAPSVHVASAPVEYKSDCCELCFSNSCSVCCAGACQQVHQFCAKDDLRYTSAGCRVHLSSTNGRLRSSSASNVCCVS